MIYRGETNKPLRRTARPEAGPGAVPARPEARGNTRERPFPSRGNAALSLGAARGQAGDQEALGEQEDDHHRRDGDQRRQRQRGERDGRRCGVGRVELRHVGQQLGEPDLDGRLPPRHHHVGQEVVVPVAGEAEEPDEGDHRRRERHGDPREDLELAGAVDARGVEQVPRYRRREVDVGEVDAERKERERQDDRERRADQPYRAELEEDRQHQRGARHEHDDEGRRQQRPPAAELGEGERVAGRNAGHEGDRERRQAVERRVGDPPPDEPALERDQRRSSSGRGSARSPSANGCSRRSWRSVLVGAISSQTSGTTKNSAKATRSRMAAARPSQCAGRDAARSPWRPSRALKETSPEDEDHAERQRDDEQDERDRRRAVEVALLEGIEEGELVQRIVLRHHPAARLGEHPRLDEELGAAGEGQDHHVGDPLPQQRDLDRPGGPDRARAVDAGRLHHVAADVVERAVHDDDPAAGAGPEGDDGEDDRQPVDLHRLDERVRGRGHGAGTETGLTRRVEHEQPQHDARGAGEGAGDVVEEAHAGRQPARADGVDDDGEQHDQHDQARQPDQQVQADMLDRRPEAVVLEDLGEVGEADECAALGEGEIDRIGRRQHAEHQEKERVEADEGDTGPGLGAFDAPALPEAGCRPPVAGWTAAVRAQAHRVSVRHRRWASGHSTL